MSIENLVSKYIMNQEYSDYLAEKKLLGNVINNSLRKPS